jgi:hypothetical protein
MASMACLRPLQRMGEEIADDALPRFAELEARVEREFAALTPVPPSLPDNPVNEGRDAADG